MAASRRWLTATAAVLVILDVSANLLDVTTSITMADKQCFLLQDIERTEITLNPNNITSEILKQQIQIQELSDTIRSERLGGEKVKPSNWVSDFTHQSLQDVNTELQELLENQHELLNLITHAIAMSRTSHRKIEPKTSHIMEPIPTATSKRAPTRLEKSFEKSFKKAAELNLDETIQEALSQTPHETAKHILTSNEALLEEQFKQVLNHRTKQHLSVGFTKATTGKTFLNYFKNVTKTITQAKATLRVITFVKQNIIHQLQNHFNYKETRTDETSKKGKRTIASIAAKFLVKMVTKKASRIAKKKIKQLMSPKPDPPIQIDRRGQALSIAVEKRHISDVWHQLYQAKQAEKRVFKERKEHTVHDTEALKNSQLALTAALYEIGERKDAARHIAKAQQQQIELVKTVFNQQLPTHLMYRMAAKSTHNKVSAKQENEEFKLTYEYYTTAKHLPTFDITTIPFRVKNSTYELKLPEKLALTDNREYSIIDPHRSCGEECLCTLNTPQNKIDDCLTEILTEKYSNTHGNPEKCAEHIIETTNQITRAIRYKNDHFSIFAGESATASVTCGQHHLSKKLSPGLNRIEIPQGCTIKTPKLKMSNTQINTEENPLTQGQDIEHDIKNLESSLKKVPKTQNNNYIQKSPTIKSILKEQLQIKARLTAEETTSTETTIVLSASVALMIAINVINLIHSRRKCACSKTDQNQENENETTEEDSLRTTHENRTTSSTPTPNNYEMSQRSSFSLTSLS